MSTVITVTGKRAKDLIEAKDGKVRVFCVGAIWCQACQDQMIQLGIVAQELHRSVGVYKIDHEKNEKLVDKYLGNSIPFTMIVRKGKVLKSVGGYEESDKILKMIEKVT